MESMKVGRLDVLREPTMEKMSDHRTACLTAAEKDNWSGATMATSWVWLTDIVMVLVKVVVMGPQLVQP